MKAFIILTLVVTLGIIFFQYSKDRDMRKLLISLGSFAVIISLGVLGNITRTVFPLYITHFVLMAFSWIGLVVYLLRDKYYWWVIFSPLLTIVLAVILEYLVGSANEVDTIRQASLY